MSSFDSSIEKSLDTSQKIILRSFGTYIESYICFISRILLDYCTESSSSLVGNP